MSNLVASEDGITVHVDGTAEDLPSRHWPPRRRVHKGTPHAMWPLVWAEDVLHYAVSFVLVGIAFAVLIHAVSGPVLHPHSFFAGRNFDDNIPQLVDSVLFVIIILEIFTTVLAHFRDGSLQLQPFLVIGIISAVREILVIGARSSLASDTGAGLHFPQQMIALGVDLGIAVFLVIALVLVKRFGITRDHSH